jgi:signal transduction histidine kinase/DNA-binding response OmpR family regulator
VTLVVVAEDNLDHQRVIAEVVRRLGRDVVVASDGAAGLAAVREHRPALVVADVDMPHLDGFQLCQAIRDDPELAATPVVLITAYLLPNDPRLAAPGALGVIGKPFSVPELGAELRRYLDLVAAPDPGRTALLDILLDCLDTAVFACDRAGRILLVNQAQRDAFAMEDGDKSIADVAHRHLVRRPGGGEMPEEEWPIYRALRGEDVNHVELLIRDQHGRPHWFTANARPVRDQHGDVVAAITSVHDISGQYRNRQYQECKNEVLKALATDPDSPDAADRVLAAIGTSLGWPYLRLWLVDEATDMLRPAAVHDVGDRSVPVPTSIARGTFLAGRCWDSGELIWVPDLNEPGAPGLPRGVDRQNYVSGGAVPVRSGDRVIGVITFLSRTRQGPDPALGVLLTGVAGVVGAFLEHRRAELLAVHLAAAGDEYMALAGHELRTPLTSIGSYVDLIAESPDDTPLGDLRDLFEVVQRNSTLLRELVDRLLAVAALESGHTPLASDPVDLTEVVAAGAAAMATAAAVRGIRLDLARLDPVTVPGDRERLGQVVEAVLSNAIKFSPGDGTVTIALVDDDVAAELTVTDTGVGVPAAEQAKLFHRLYRGSNARHTGIPGSGLGLALCRVVVERHHGTISMASHESQGTSVKIRLPK